MKGRFGDAIALGSLGSKQVRGNWTPPGAQPTLQINRWVRNGKHPNAIAENMKRELASQCALYRSKEYFSALYPLAGGNPTSNDEVKSRFAFHSGPYAHAACVIVALTQPTVGGLQSYAQLDLSTSATESPVAVSATMNYGAAVDTLGGWPYVKLYASYVTISPDTDYY